MSKTPSLSLWQQGYQPMRRVNRGEYSILKPSPEGVKPTCYIVDIIRMTCTCPGFVGRRSRKGCKVN